MVFRSFLISIFLVIVFSTPFRPQLKNLNFVSDAINGFVTMSGILTAFTGYLITHLIPRLKDTPKKWIGKRIAVIIVAIAFGLVFVMLGLAGLVFGSLEGAYNTALFGTFLIILVFFEVMFMVVIREMEQTTNLRDIS